MAGLLKLVMKLEVKLIGKLESLLNSIPALLIKAGESRKLVKTKAEGLPRLARAQGSFSVWPGRNLILGIGRNAFIGRGAETPESKGS